MLGNGWYKGRFGLGNRRESFGNRFQMIAEIHLEDASGNVTVIPSDGSWSYCGSDTAISDIYDGVKARASEPGPRSCEQYH